MYQTYDIVDRNTRTREHVYVIPAQLWTELPLQAWDGIDGVVAKKLRRLHRKAEIHKGPMLEFSIAEQLGLRVFGPRPPYDLGDPQIHRVLLAWLETNSKDPATGKNILAPVPVFPDHPSYLNLIETIEEDTQDAQSHPEHPTTGSE